MFARIVAGLTAWGIVIPAAFALLVAVANDARAQIVDGCDITPADNLTHAQSVYLQTQVDRCTEQNWGVQQRPGRDCWCNAPVRPGDSDSCLEDGVVFCQLAVRTIPNSNRYCENHFGIGLQHLPDADDHPPDVCFVSSCPDGMEPAGINRDGATECRACEEGKVLREDGYCGCPAGKVALEGGGCGCPEDSFQLPDGGCYQQLPVPVACMTFSMVDEYQNQLSACHNQGWNVREINPGGDFGCYCDVRVKHDDDSQCVEGVNRCQLSAGVGGDVSCLEHFGLGLAHLPQLTEENYNACFVSHCPGGMEPAGVNMNGATECACPADREEVNGQCVCLAAYVEVDGACMLNVPGTPTATVLSDSHYVSVAWAAAPSVGLSPRYEVRRQADGGVFVSVAAEAEFYVDTDVTAGTTLRYRARLESSTVTLSLSAASSPVVIPDLDCAGMDLPEATGKEAERGLCGEACLADELLRGGECLAGNQPGTPVAALLTDHAVSVSWSAADEAGAGAAYVVWREVNGAGRSAAAATVSVLFYVDAAVTAGWTVSYRASVHDADAIVSEASEAVVIPDLNCDAFLRTAGARGSCGECLATAPGGAAVTVAALSAVGRALEAAGRFADACVPTTGEFLDVPEALLCDVFGGELQRTAGEERVCSGLDAADTFCIADAAAEAGYAFSCRGLLKHVRQCNFEYNRPAANPFLCGPRCLTVGGVQQVPRGGRCANP